MRKSTTRSKAKTARRRTVSAERILALSVQTATPFLLDAERAFRERIIKYLVDRYRDEVLIETTIPLPQKAETKVRRAV